jgi:hypothetical protein
MNNSNPGNCQHLTGMLTEKHLVLRELGVLNGHIDPDGTTGDGTIIGYQFDCACGRSWAFEQGDIPLPTMPAWLKSFIEAL